MSAPTILVDAGRIRQLPHNLIKNAQEATPAGERCNVTLVTRHRDEAGFHGIELQVADHGPGFSDEVMERLFEPYVTTKAKGTGLGMPIVKKIVEEHNGSISAENTPTGACVTVRLPMPEVVRLEQSAEGKQ